MDKSVLICWNYLCDYYLKQARLFLYWIHERKVGEIECRANCANLGGMYLKWLSILRAILLHAFTTESTF